jgi:hypothetical protein
VVARRDVRRLGAGSPAWHAPFVHPGDSNLDRLPQTKSPPRRRGGRIDGIRAWLSRCA